ncbi:metallo-beta-lactamase family protein [alpha proteobacterium U9-1i]|nr:metallo-beta-lactamase family protein [alpha proteobacterium U9-1i]
MKEWAWGIGALAILAAAIGGTYVFRGEIATVLLTSAARDGVRADLPQKLPDGLHAVFCGTGSPLPDRSRAGPCFAVIAGERVFVFDAGESAAETLSLMGISLGDVEAVYLTHLHSDHFDGLAPMALQHWAMATATEPLGVIGPTGTTRLAAGLNEAYAIDHAYRTAHHAPDVLPPTGGGLRPTDFVVPTVDGETVLLRDEEGLRIFAFRVDHAPTDAVGYRIEYAGRSIVVSGDTARSRSLTMAARGADLLVHEAISPELDRIMHDATAEAGRDTLASIFTDILDYHTTPEQAGEVAEEAGVGALAITHFLPQTPVPGLASTFVRDAKRAYRGPVWAMRDGDVISLPRTGGVRRHNYLRF